mmetsp:Transcript_48668/g.75985  ORF Transcript_48668/g.75985 Transcript_48668/m.75985 type:complete len:121 (+) Transcript_48668:251-613(+)
MIENNYMNAIPTVDQYPMKVQPSSSGYPTDVIGGGFPIISGQDAPISASSLGYSDWTNFNTNSIVENATTPAPSRDEDNPAVIRFPSLILHPFSTMFCSCGRAEGPQAYRHEPLCRGRGE